MKKIIILLCAVFAVAKGYELVDSVDRPDAFLKVHNMQYKRILQKYLSRLEMFEQSYKERANIIAVQSQFLIDKILQTDQRFKPMEVLSDIHKNCIQTYGNTTHNVDHTRGDVNVCINQALLKLENLISEAVAVKDSLINHYEVSFERDRKACGNRETLTYTSCIIKATEKSQEYLAQNQKDFEYAYDAAACKANELIKRAIECYYGHQHDAIAAISTANLLIDNCISGAETECEPCAEHTCDVSLTTHVDHTVPRIPNPFYTENFKRGCVVLAAQYN